VSKLYKCSHDKLLLLVKQETEVVLSLGWVSGLDFQVTQ